MGPESALLAATALHLGFQAVVTVVVYPALADLPADRWSAGHDAHSRRVVAVVGPVYLAVAAASLWALVALPLKIPLLLAVLGSGLAELATAFVAAPVHGRLGREGRTPRLVGRLLGADRVRLFGAALAAGAAVLV